jgi:hypothetical protein
LFGMCVKNRPFTNNFAIEPARELRGWTAQDPAVLASESFQDGCELSEGEIRQYK